MVKVYFNLIVKGLMKLEDIPEKWRDAVKKLLSQNGVTEEESKESKNEEQSTNDGLIAHRK